jgi:hypothetical protein
VAPPVEDPAAPVVPAPPAAPVDPATPPSAPLAPETCPPVPAEPLALVPPLPPPPSAVTLTEPQPAIATMRANVNEAKERRSIMRGAPSREAWGRTLPLCIGRAGTDQVLRDGSSHTRVPRRDGASENRGRRDGA